MKMKIDHVYRELLSMKVATTSDIVKVVERLTNLKPLSQYVHTKYIAPLQKKGLLSRVRKGLYYVRSPNEGANRPEMDKYLIASKVRKEYYISHHAALELNGAAESAFWTVHISVDKGSRFQTFSYNDIKFRPVLTRDVKLHTMVFPRKGSSIIASNPSRTFIDCIDKPENVGGWEECLKSLQSLANVDIAEMIDVLEVYNKNILTNKAGYVLDLLRRNSVYYEHISDTDLSRLEKMLSKPMYYVGNSHEYTRSKRWHLYVPTDFESYLRGI
jgi:predicted transcriptional regulator of viral defense system